MTGTLGLFSLVDLFQLLAASKRTGRLSVQHPSGRARFYFERGQLRHAEFGDLEGPAAVDALFGDERGAFAFTAGLPAPRTTVEASTEAIVLDALRRLDESRRSGEKPPMVERDAVPFGAEDGGARPSLGSPEQRVLAAVNGHWTVARIARELDIAEEEARAVVTRLVHVGLLRIRTRRPRTARLVVRLAPAAVPVGGVAVDAGIVRAWREVVGDFDEVALKLPDGSAVAVPLIASEGAGAYLWVPRVNLLRLGLRVDDTVLARPIHGSDDGPA
ncbi:MAG: DUF4388 domain-containing protein [Trueperaceae bacterium]|nr:DUF4388 domain-containing protein [Trueperaceae bacterium]